MSAPRTVVLVGGGHAHVQVLRRWAMDPPKDLRLLVVLDRAVAVYSGMVPGCVAGDYSVSELEIDVLPLARRARAGVILSAATDLDPVRHEIQLQDRPPLHFDLASIDVGSTVRGLDLPGVREHTLATRPIGAFIHAVDARIEALAALGRPPHIIVVGGGAAGVELTLTLDSRLREKGLTPTFSVVTGDAEPLAGASPRTRRAIARELARRGVEVIAAQRVTRAHESGVVLESRASRGTDADSVPTERSADLVIWATGAAPVAFPACEGVSTLARDERGFLAIRNTLQTVGFDDVFAVGDCAQLVEHAWVPKAGVYAVRQGPVLEQNLRARLDDRPLRDYRPQRDFLSLLHLGSRRALGSKWGFAWAGPAVFRLKDWIDRRFMDRFQMLDADGLPRPSNAQLGAMGGSAGGSRHDPAHEEQDAMSCGGCAAKLGALPLTEALAQLPPAPRDDSVLLGLEARDDVAATVDDHGRTTLHNVDVIRAFCDDPWLVGRVAASNALSDLYAKGGKPRHAQAVIGLPEQDDPRAAQELLFQTLAGVRQTLDAVGVSLLGGHTTIGDALSVGLAVSGDGPAPDALLRQSGAQPGDRLLLTQPLGTGIVLAADMRGEARGEWVEAAHAAMQRINDVASRIALAGGVRAATDVTGFGFAGHLLTLLEPAGLVARIDRDAIPLLPGARILWETGLRSTAHPPNRAAFLGRVEGASEADEAWLFDPQTAGGLLLAVAPEHVQRLIDAFDAAGEPPIVEIGQLTPDHAPKTGGGRASIRIV